MTRGRVTYFIPQAHTGNCVRERIWKEMKVKVPGRSKLGQVRMSMVSADETEIGTHICITVH